MADGCASLANSSIMNGITECKKTARQSYLLRRSSNLAKQRDVCFIDCYAQNVYLHL